MLSNLSSRLISFVASTTLWVTLAVAAVSTASAEKLTVRVDFSPWGIHGPLHLAVEKGWFAEEGLDIEIQDGKGTTNTIQLVAAGHVDVGQVALGLMAPARDQGLPVKSFAGWIRKSDLAALIDRKLNVKTVHDMTGLRLVLFAQNPFVPFIDAFLNNGGLQREDVNVLFVEPATMISTYTSGNADGLLVVGPWGQPIVEETRPVSPVLAADYGIAFPSYGFMANESTLETRREDLEKLVRVQIKAWKYIYDENHIDEAVQAIINQRPEANLNPTVLKGQLDAYRNFLFTDATKDKIYGWQSEHDWRKAIELMEAAKVIEMGSEPSDFYTNTIVEAVTEE